MITNLMETYSIDVVWEDRSNRNYTKIITEMKE